MYGLIVTLCKEIKLRLIRRRKNKMKNGRKNGREGIKKFMFSENTNGVKGGIE